MAKKVIASVKQEKKSYAKVIRAFRSKKSGHYAFKSEIVPADEVKARLSKNEGTDSASS